MRNNPPALKPWPVTPICSIRTLNTNLRSLHFLQRESENLSLSHVSPGLWLDRMGMPHLSVWGLLLSSAATSELRRGVLWGCHPHLTGGDSKKAGISEAGSAMLEKLKSGFNCCCGKDRPLPGWRCVLGLMLPGEWGRQESQRKHTGRHGKEHTSLLVSSFLASLYLPGERNSRVKKACWYDA